MRGWRSAPRQRNPAIFIALNASCYNTSEDVVADDDGRREHLGAGGCPYKDKVSPLLARPLPDPASVL